MKIQATNLSSSLDFLKKLKRNNNREWFNKNKERYLYEKEQIEAFAAALLAELNSHDLIETESGKKSLHWIYRDVRFSKDKSPYRTCWSGSFRRATKFRRGGYYFHIEPGNNYIEGGFQGPGPQDLKRIRDEISFDGAELQKILQSKTIVSAFGQLQGEQLKTAPRGYDASNEFIELLRYKQFLLRRHFTDDEVLAANFVKEAAKTFKNLRPFFDYMSMVLSTDNNGIGVVGN